MPYAENTNLTSICTHKEDRCVCGEEAHYTKRLIKNNEQILIGCSESYGARCWEHFRNP